jgi:Ca-activated chloride channel family protein
MPFGTGRIIVTIDHPWVLLLGPLIVTLAMMRRGASPHAPTPHAGPLATITPSLRLKIRRPVLFLGFTGSLLLLSLAASRPYSVLREIRPKEARNVILAIDLSRSMSMADFRIGDRMITRFAGVQGVVADFLERRHDDRIGLVVFGAAAFVQSPLTYDHRIIAELVRALSVGVAGDGTALGDGLGVSIKRALEVEAESRAVVLLTDGVSTAGSVSPRQAAAVARDKGVTVHTIGIGGEGQYPGRTGREFDEVLLNEIAETTGGTYSNANSVEQLAKIYDRIESLSTSNLEKPAEILVVEHFVPVLTASLILYGITLILSRTILRRLP